MKLAITIDTEEDNWNCYSRDDNPCSNIEQLLPLQELFDTYNVIPAYLITYPVAQNENARIILKQFLSENRCEIGTHCHPWNNPPFDEELSLQNSMLSNLPYELVFKKISNLHHAITETFGTKPVAFRSGRFAFNSNVAKALTLLGYKIDTSITPFWNWSADYGPDFSNCTPSPYRFFEDAIFTPDPDGTLLELPLSIGFLQNNFKIANFVYKWLRRKPFNYLKVIGMLSHIHLLNVACLLPENYTEKEMIGIAKVFKNKNYPILNMMFHSTSLHAGRSVFTKTKADEERIFRRIKTFLEFAKTEGIDCIKLSDTPQLIPNDI
jgi:hypothetical protein